MKRTADLPPVLVVASIVTYVGLLCWLDGESEGYIVDRFMQGTMGVGVRRKILEVAVHWAIVMVLFTVGAGSLTFNLMSAEVESCGLVYQRILSVVGLVGLNLIIWERIVVVLRDIVKSNDLSGMAATLLLTMALAVLLMLSNVAVVVELVCPMHFTPGVPDLEVAVWKGTREAQDESTSRILDPSTPPYIPNLFSNYHSECDICSTDFNSFKTQKPASFDEDDSLDECYETVLDQRGEGAESSVNRIQIVKSPMRKDPSVSDSVGLENRVIVEEKTTCNISTETGTNSTVRFPTPQLLWKRVCEEKGVFKYSVWMKISAIVCSVMLMHSCVSSISCFRDLTSDWRLIVDVIEIFETKGTLENDPQVGSKSLNGMQMQEFPERQNQKHVHIIHDGEQFEILDHNDYNAYHQEVEQVKGFIVVHSTTLMNILLYVSGVVDKYRSMVIVGYIVSTLVAFWGLLMVFANHKELVVNLDSRQSNACQGKICVQKFWDRSNPAYSTAGAVYFLGTLVSTSLIQQHLLGTLISLMLAIAANASDLGRLVALIGHQPIVMLCFLVVTIPMIQFLGNHCLSDGLHVRYPVWFFLFMFLFSVGNFVWGTFLGVYRLAVLSVSMIMTVNRVDSAEYQTKQGIDNGHSAFMSMALLSEQIQAVTFEPQQNKPHSQLAGSNRC